MSRQRFGCQSLSSSVLTLAVLPTWQERSLLREQTDWRFLTVSTGPTSIRKRCRDPNGIEFKEGLK
jgi:hypothetical protein